MIKHLLRAATPLVFDSIGVILFAVLLALHVNLVAATVVGVVVAGGMVAWECLRGRHVPPLQWLSLAMVVISAAATLFTGDPHFVMIKPTIVYAAIGTAMLRRGWMDRYVAAEDIDDIRDLMTVFGFVWAGLMFATAALNLIVAIAFTAWWPIFIGTFPLFSKLLLFAVQFGVVYTVGRARGRRARQDADRTVPHGNAILGPSGN